MYNSQETVLKIKVLAKKQGIAVANLLESCNLNINALSQSAKSQEGMKAKNLYAIANYLDCSIDYLLGRTDDPNSHKNQPTNAVNGNYNAVDNSSVTVTTPVLDEHQKLLIELYNKLSPIEQVELIARLNKSNI